MLQCSRSQDALSPFGDKPTPSPSRSDPLHDNSHECTQAPAGCGVCPPEYASAPRTLKGQPASVNPYGHWLETNAWSRESAQQAAIPWRSEEHTSELPSLLRIS